MGNHIAETRSAAGMSKTTLCYTGVSKERENENLKATRAAIRETLPVDYITIPAYNNRRIIKIKQKRRWFTYELQDFRSNKKNKKILYNFCNTMGIYIHSISHAINNWISWGTDTT